MMTTLRRFGILLRQALDRDAEPIRILSGLIVGLFVLFEYLDPDDRINRALDYARPQSRSDGGPIFSMIRRSPASPAGAGWSRRSTTGALPSWSQGTWWSSIRRTTRTSRRRLGEEWLSAEVYSMNQFLQFCESDGSFLC
ncbi:MAG TPA: hypothetical protein VLE23_12495 [Geminicoccaceae bacterium]|nr:hypothetical protein [Geminicoccaceae bacterium]